SPEPKSIFRPVTRKQFNSMLMKIQKDNMIVMYFASKLAAKDLNCGECFSHLKLIQPMNYYSQVEEPLRALQEVSVKTNKIIWHKPIILHQKRLSLKMQLPCQPGQIYAFDFSDHDLMAHDHAMGVSTDQLANCSVVHAYTALAEDEQSYMRRKNHAVERRIRKKQFFNRRRERKNSSPHLSFVTQNETRILTILRREEVVIAFNRIMLATKESTGKWAHIHRTNLTLVEGNNTMQLGMYNQPDLDEGLVIALDTHSGPLLIEVLPIKGNWYLTRVILDDTIFFSTDLIYFSSDFSLCCSAISFFSKNKELLSLFDFYLDIITTPNANGMEMTYTAKPCWNCSEVLTPTLTQTLIVMFIFLTILGICILFITSIGRNTLIQVAAEPDLYIKTDQ
ncbi:hypothetical protein KR032_011390, partial [Drosophila birchii]